MSDERRHNFHLDNAFSIFTVQGVLAHFTSSSSTLALFLSSCEHLPSYLVTKVAVPSLPVVWWNSWRHIRFRSNLSSWPSNIAFVFFTKYIFIFQFNMHVVSHRKYGTHATAEIYIRVLTSSWLRWLCYLSSCILYLSDGLRYSLSLSITLFRNVLCSQYAYTYSTSKTMMEEG